MATAEKVKSRRTASREQRRQQLIDATMKCIARKGLTGMTLSDVANEAGLSQGIVNLHFESKENLLTETLLSLADEYGMIPTGSRDFHGFTTHQTPDLLGTTEMDDSFLPRFQEVWNSPDGEGKLADR